MWSRAMRVPGARVDHLDLAAAQVEHGHGGAQHLALYLNLGVRRVDRDRDLVRPSLHEQSPLSRFEDEAVQEPGRDHYREVSAAQRHERTYAPFLGRPEPLDQRRVRPYTGAACFAGGFIRVERERCEQHVARRKDRQCALLPDLSRVGERR